MFIPCIKDMRTLKFNNSITNDKVGGEGIALKNKNKVVNW